MRDTPECVSAGHWSCRDIAELVEKYDAAGKRSGLVDGSG